MSHLLENRQISGIAQEMGYHSLSPAEILMLQEREEGEMSEADVMQARCECVSSILQAVTHEAVTVEEVRNRVAAIAAQMLPDLLLGQRIWGDRAELYRLRSTQIRPFAWDEMAGPQLLRVLVLKGWESREVGKRTLCLLYGTQPDKAQRPPMARSFAAIGEAIGLKAKNKRSAISAAMQSIVQDLQKGTQRRSRPSPHQKPWYAKKGQCCERLSQSMKGKKNRQKKGEPHV